MATAIRKELKQEKWQNLMLKDATIFQIVKHVYTKHSTVIWFVIACVGWGLGLSGRLA